MHQTCLGLGWALSGNFHSLPQFALNPDKMRVLLAVFMLALSLGYNFRVEDVFEPAEDFVDTDRQGDSLNDNIPAVFAVSFGASLLANVLLGGGGDASANDVPSQGILTFATLGKMLAKLMLFYCLLAYRHSLNQCQCYIIISINMF